MLSSETITPPDGAGAASVTVPVEVAPPCKVAGFRLIPPSVTVLGPAAATVSDAVALERDAAVTVTVRVEATADVATAKVAVLCPAVTVTLAGTVTAGSELDRFTETPPRIAGTASVTVPVAPAPPVTEDGLIANPKTIASDGSAAWIVRLVETEFAEVAVNVTVVFVATGLLDTGNEAELLPAAIITDAVTWAAAFPLCRVTSTPPVAAGADNVTVPVEEAPLAIDEGETESEAMVP